MTTAAALPRLARYCLRAIQALAVVGIVAYGWATFLPGFCPETLRDATEGWLYPGLFFVAGIVAGARAFAERTDALAWGAIGVSLIAWGASEAYQDIAYGIYGEEPVLGVADVLYGSFYVAAFFAIVMLVRSRTRDFRPSLWLDGLVGVLAVASLGAVLVLGPVSNAPEADRVAVDLGYLLADFLTIGFVIGAFTLLSWRPGRDFAWIGAAMATMAAADAFGLWVTATDADVAMWWVAAWPMSATIVAFAAWQAVPQSTRQRLEGLRVVAMPAAFSLLALGLLAAQAFVDVHPLGFGLAVAALVMAIVRMSLTFRENVSLLHRTRYQAYTDALTGLENRRKLMVDLEEALPKASVDEPCAVALFDLDGFKQYNDSFGHPAGDALLARLGANLMSAVDGLGSAYRLGGDEFCVLTKGDEPLMRALIEEARQSLSEEGEAFRVASSCGLVVIPREANSVSAALNVADERLYTDKGERKRITVAAQTSDALIQVVREREPALGEHQSEVARLARAVGRHLGLQDTEVEQLGRAGELHDIGKVAIPDAILSKPGPLDELEWGLVRQHTLVGERIVAAAPTLAPIAELVRGSHERFDGGGYPDGLIGDAIPLGARIVSACDAYHVMTCERPYRNAISSDQALDELRRCAGEQFDPRVVEALCALLEASVAERVHQPAA